MQTSNKEGKKVLLRVSNLKQYFPLKKKGLFVKANDGITLDQLRDHAHQIADFFQL